MRPETVSYPPGAEALPGVWLDARQALREVLENVTFADLVARSQARGRDAAATGAGEGGGA